MAGPLAGLTIVEMAGLGPGPFAAMMLADHGASVIRVERAGMIAVPNDPLLRGRQSIALDLKREECRAVVRKLCASADGLVEGYRPGVMERLELGPDALIAANPKLVYGRVTGWGQSGPLAAEAGHDINYLAITGLLHGIGPKERPVVPVNYIADYAGGGMMLAFGMVAALLAVAARREGAGDRRGDERRRGADRRADLWPARGGGVARRARGQSARRGRAGLWRLSLPRRQVPRARGDRAAVSRQPVQGAGACPTAPTASRLRRCWRRAAATIGRGISPATDACVAPVLDLGEAPVHPHNIARRTFLDLDGVFQPAPAPHYSRHDPRPARPAAPRGTGRARRSSSSLAMTPDEIGQILA